MTDEFKYDVFLSHSAKNKDTVREIAHRLKSDGVKVWFDEWEIRPGDSIPAKIEDGLEHSRVLVLCLSQAALAADWPHLESHTFRFKDPLNHNRRFIPLRLDDAPTKGSLVQFSYIDWRPNQREKEYPKLFEACRQVEKSSPAEVIVTKDSTARRVQLNFDSRYIYHYAFGSKGERALVTHRNNNIQLWDLGTGECLREFVGHSDLVHSIVWSNDQRLAVSGSYDRTARIWDVETGRTLVVLKGHTDKIKKVALSGDQRIVLSGSDDKTCRVWDVETGRCISVFKGHTGTVEGVGSSPGNSYAISGSWDGTVRLWDLQREYCFRVLEGHSGHVRSVAWSGDNQFIVTGSDDQTVRIWDFETGRCTRVLEGHMGWVLSIAWNPNSPFILSGATDNTARLWNIASGNCLRVLDIHSSNIEDLAWSDDGKRGLVGAVRGGVSIWDLSGLATTSLQLPRQSQPISQRAPDQVQYSNAKVLLVGNSAAGKTGLSNRLALDTYKETDSTVGAWATQWKLPLPEGDAGENVAFVPGPSSGADDQAERLGSVAQATNVEREVWLWDFGGQADQRLIHQFYMDHTQVAALVFDPQKPELLEELGTWDRDLTRAATGDFRKLLVAGRIDAGGLRSVSREQVEEFAREHGFARYIESSAKENIGCEELKAAICELIDWQSIAKRTTPALFKRLKEEIVALKDEGRVLMRFNELRESLTLRISGRQGEATAEPRGSDGDSEEWLGGSLALATNRFTDQELKTVISLLAGPGVVWELGFGSWVLLAPELINAYAQAVIRTIQEDDRELGCITEECVLGGKLSFPNELQRMPDEEERILLLAMHRLLVENSLCLSEPTDTGTLLIFPSYARRERPDLIEHPSVLVSYQFEGFLDEIYATLVVRLHRISPFTTTNLWNGAADFETMTGQKLGVKLSRKAAGKAELLVYFDPNLPVGERMIFSKYVQEHLLRKARDRDQVKRLRHWICEKCGEPVANRERAMQRLSDDGAKAKIICVNCEQYVQLWDEMEAAFADPDIMRRVRELEAEEQHELDNESKERALVGDVVSTVALAGQISREFPVSDHGIDMEIEFKNDADEATGQRLYLQLKSGDAYLTKRKRDGAEIFKIPKQRHVKYWMEQAYPVMLVIRNSEGEIRWMEIRDHLKKVTNDGEKQVRQIEFTGECFDVMSVRHWRENALAN